MKKHCLLLFILGLVIAGLPVPAAAAPDQFIGDAAIYGGQTAAIEPNVLIIIDDSGSMSQAADPTAIGQPYNPATTYTQTANCTDQSGPDNLCITTTVYNATGANSVFLNNVSSVAASCTWTISAQNDTKLQPQNLLNTTGQYNGPKLNADGTCCYQSVKINTGTKKNPIYTTYPNGSCGSATYEMGNYINWLYDNPSASMAKLTIAKSVMGTLVQATAGVRFGVMTYFYKGGTPSGGTFLNDTNVNGTGFSYISTVQDMDTTFSGALTNRDALVETLNTLSPQGATPIGQTMYEAMRYFSGGAPAFGATIGTSGGAYTSPIQYSCQKNYLIFITDGMTNSDTDNANGDLSKLCNKGDCDGDKMEPLANWPPPGVCDAGTCPGPYNHIADDVAKYIYEHDLMTGLASTSQNNVTTFTIGFGSVSSNPTAVAFLQRMADSAHGRGQYYSATSAQTLSKALTSIISQIFAVNSAFVAPVVPLNPENKVYTGNRVFMGFFKPSDQALWNGNVKKYALGCDCVTDAKCPVCKPMTDADQTKNAGALNGNYNVVDIHGRYATYVDSNGDGYDDRDHAKLPLGMVDGSFRTSAWSFWSTTADGGDVNLGGVGGVLMNRNFSISSVTASATGTPRNIYTYMGTKTALTDPSNAFSTTNAALTPAALGLPGAVITNGTATDAQTLINFVQGFDVYDFNANGNYTEKRPWIFGDVLHSRPAIVEYATYSLQKEADCTANKTIVYVGSNDGMLHAINDCDGSEAWAFIPPALLPNLQYMVGPIHTYFVDSSPRYFTTGGKTILVVALRRGGGVTAIPITGFYYALDVTNPASPVYLWTISNATAGFSDMGEAWSEPRGGPINTGDYALFIGGGYDNCNEDGRYGSTQTFSGVCVGSASTTDGGNAVSSGTTAVNTLSAANYKGRAVYVVNINTGALIWSYTQASNPPLEFAIASEMTTVDYNSDSVIDLLYVGDLGGNLWRFDLTATDKTKWKATKIFKSNPGYTGYPVSLPDSDPGGRKIFYKPVATMEANGVIRLYFGTGDREHPLNTQVVDRLYEVVDKGQTSAVNESNLIDSSAGQSSLTAGQISQLLQDVESTSDLKNTKWYGWYIRLNQNAGEKDLSPTALANMVAYFTTYSPTGTVGTDPCQAGNLGTGRLYSVWYSNAGVVPSGTQTVPNPGRQTPVTGDVLGSGIPSGVVIAGDTLLISSGGGPTERKPRPGGNILQIYWRTK